HRSAGSPASPPPRPPRSARLGGVDGGGGERNRAAGAQRAHPQGRRGARSPAPAPTPGAGGAPGPPGSHRAEAPVKRIEGVALRAGGPRFELLDQTRLPHSEVWLDATDPEAMVGHIQRLSVRGAPLIGVAAALTIGSLAERGADGPELRRALRLLREARPTAVNLAWAMDRLRAVLDGGGS